MKILVLRLSSIGDIVLSSGVWRALKQQIGAEVHLLVKPAFAEIVRYNPHLTKVWTYQEADLEALKKEHFDFCLDLHRNWRTGRLRRSLACPSAKFEKLNFDKWLLTALKINRLKDKGSVVDRYFKAAETLGIRPDGQGLEHYWSEQAEAQAQALTYPPQGFVALVIGATAATKRMPKEGLLQICRESPLPVYLLGGPEDAEVGEWLAAQAGAQVLNFAGQASLGLSAALLARARAVVAHDTGFMHIAAALHKPMLVLWGNTVPDFGFAPHYPKGMEHLSQNLEVQGLSCRPCSKLGSNRCPKGHFRCMKDQDLSRVKNWLLAFV